MLKAHKSGIVAIILIVIFGGLLSTAYVTRKKKMLAHPLQQLVLRHYSH